MESVVDKIDDIVDSLIKDTDVISFISKEIDYRDKRNYIFYHLKNDCRSSNYLHFNSFLYEVYYDVQKKTGYDLGFCPNFVSNFRNKLNKFFNSAQYDNNDSNKCSLDDSCTSCKGNKSDCKK